MTHVFIIETSFGIISKVTGTVIVFINDKLEPACESSNISLPYSSKWTEKQTHDKITKYRVGCGDFTAMVTVYKNALTAKITEGHFTRDSFCKMNLKYE